MPFRGLTMLKSRKLVIKGGLCYRFAMVPLGWLNVSHVSEPRTRGDLMWPHWSVVTTASAGPLSCQII